MKRIETPQALCRAGAARCDITPPIGIYHRMWGAALHDRATGIHLPLLATVLWLEPRESDATANSGQIIASLDHCILDTLEMNRIRLAIAEAVAIPIESVQVSLTHTHGSGWMARSRSQLPGGEWIGPYLDDLVVRVSQASIEAKAQRCPATIVYGSGQCTLAAHRDYWDEDQQRFVCGFNPQGPSDATLVVADVTSDSGLKIATLVNYACHPTTLAWDNTLISPDWVGAMRKVVESNWGGLCLFLQGASGDLGPRDGFVGDLAVADRNGRQVGYSALAALESLPPVGTDYVYSGAVISGTAIGTWTHQPLDTDRQIRLQRWNWTTIVVELPYRSDLPTLEQTIAEKAHWQEKESLARNSNDEFAIRDARAQVEQRTRQMTRLEALVPGRSYPLQIRIGVLGDAIWIGIPGEHYQIFQRTLRERFAPTPVMIATLTNDWQPGYVPPAHVYGYEIYQEVIAATSIGCAEFLIESVTRAMKSLSESDPLLRR